MSETLPHVREVLAEHYRILRELGEGGMATVYLALDLKHHRQVAIKVLRPGLAASLGPDRFLREIETVARLAHPNILPLHDSGSADGLLYYVMPYVEGESLRARLNRERQLPLDDALRIGEEVADALSHAHAQGVIHRDIKPENILLQAGHAVVADFGIARALTAAGASRLTGTGLAVGTPGYMSPEQATGDLAVDARTDVYALGCVIYEMLGGEPPYTGPTPQAILARVLTEDPRPLVRLRESVTPALDQAVRKALARTPADRFATAADFKAALRTPTAAGALLAPPPARVRLRRALLVAGVLAAAALGVIVVRGILAGPATGDDRLGVAVFPFHATLAEAAEWSEQVPDLLATVLDGTPGVRVADPWSLWSGLRTQRGARAVSPADVNDASRLARRAGASRFLLGTIAPDPGGFSLTVRVYRVGSRDPLHTVTLAGSADSLGPLVQRLAVELITRVRPGDAVVVPELEGYATRSAGALKAYLRAKEAMRRGLVADAEAAIDTALAVDSTFALGLVEAVKIKTWAQFMRGQPFAGFLALLDRAERYADSLSERNRLRLQATRASVRTEGAAAARAARRILELDSTDFDAWTSLAYFHR
ncbi:MAG TPA: serine/threonine-protein kinase, partial [Gemmatimonadales bacterium]